MKFRTNALIISILIGFNGFAQTLVDNKATKKTKLLYTNLQRISTQGIMFGHQDDLAYGVTWRNEEGRSDVKDVSGKYPAVFGWELGGIHGSFNLDTVYFEDMKGWIKDVYKMGGVNTISWHMYNPVTGGTTWDNTPAVKNILPGGDKHEYYKKMLDAFISFIKDLKVGGTPIPLVFRPFHEQTGGWFWWGKGNCTPDEFKIMWKFTVDYLKGEGGLHNLLYAYSTDVFNSEAEYLLFYPGDDYVDILGFDDYQSIRSIERRDDLVKRLKTVVSLAVEKNKVAVFSETGLETINYPNWWTEVLLGGFKADPEASKIAYVMVWRNGRKDHHYAPYTGHNSAPDFIKFEQDDLTLFVDDLPKMYNKPKN